MTKPVNPGVAQHAMPSAQPVPRFQNPLTNPNLGRVVDFISNLNGNTDMLAQHLARLGPPPAINMPQQQSQVGGALIQAANPIMQAIRSKLPGLFGGSSTPPPPGGVGGALVGQPQNPNGSTY